MDIKSKYFKNSRCLVAGGNGFIGSRVVDALVGLGAKEVAVLGHNSVEKKGLSIRYISCDLTKLESVETIKKLGAFEYIFNLVGVTDQRMPHPNPMELFDANVRTLMNLTQGVKWERVKGAVHTGSNAEYGSQSLPHTEDLNPEPTNMYGWSKASASSYALTMTKAGIAKWRVARPFFVYGPGKKMGLIPQLAKTLMGGGTFEILGNSTRDPVFVDDVAEGLIRLAICDVAKGEIVNICNGKEVPIRRIAEMMRRKIGRGEIIFTLHSRSGDMLKSCGSVQKLKRLTKWRPSTTLSEGLDRVIQE